MNEQERADWLARAVEHLLGGTRMPDPPPGLDPEELEGLMRAARARLEVAREVAHAGLQHEGAVWHEVLSRLENGQRTSDWETDRITNSIIDAGDLAADPEAEAAESEELKEIIQLRRRMAEEVASQAEAHRAAVWRQVQSRIQARSRRKGLFSFLRRSQEEADRLAPAFDGLVVGQTLWESGDSRLEELIQLARTRREIGQLVQDASAGSQERLWARIRSALSDPQSDAPVRRAFAVKRTAWPKFAAVAAGVALVVAALGPLPATGLADHPVGEFVQFLGDHAGVTESGEPPPAAPADAEVIQGTEVSTEEAARLLGLSLREPSSLPGGYRLTSSSFYPEAISAEEGGMFLLAYASAEGELQVFQQQASGSDIGVEQGAATDVALTDGVPATYIDGSWQPTGGQFAWGADSGQSIVFDRDGVRTIIQYRGPRMAASFLAEIAQSMAAPAVSQ